MNWTKQAEDLFNSWAKTQQSAWQNWQQLMDPDAAQSQLQENWQKMVAIWEDAVKNSLSAQTGWMQTWVDSLDGQPGVPDDMVKWVEQAKELNQRWAENQEKLWQGWFDLMKQVKPMPAPNGGVVDSQKLFEAWQESTQKVMDAQTKWMNMFANQTASKNGK